MNNLNTMHEILPNLPLSNVNIVPIVPERSGGNRNTRKQISPSKHWCFTYNSYLENNINDFLTVCSNSSKKYVFQEEIGESGNKHLQGYICFNKKLRPKSIFTNHPTIHWEKARNWRASIAYCSDPDKRAPGGRIWTQGVDCMSTVKTISTDQLYEWQEEILKELKGEPDERKIRWVWESKGNVGKTSFCKYICVHEKGLILSGKGNDMKYGIIKYHEKHGNYPKIVIIDIPRSVQDYISYSGIEEIKNGLFFCGKYESDMCVYNNPHVVCFSNAPPDRDKFSHDRWCISQIIDNKLFY